MADVHRGNGGRGASPEDWAIAAPARNRAAPAEHFGKAKICVSANSTLAAYLWPHIRTLRHERSGSGVQLPTGWGIFALATIRVSEMNLVLDWECIFDRNVITVFIGMNARVGIKCPSPPRQKRKNDS